MKVVVTGVGRLPRLAHPAAAPRPDRPRGRRRRPATPGPSCADACSPAPTPSSTSPASTAATTTRCRRATSDLAEDLADAVARRGPPAARRLRQLDPGRQRHALRHGQGRGARDPRPGSRGDRRLTSSTSGCQPLRRARPPGIQLASSRPSSTPSREASTPQVDRPPGRACCTPRAPPQALIDGLTTATRRASTRASTPVGVQEVLDLLQRVRGDLRDRRDPRPLDALPVDLFNTYRAALFPAALPDRARRRTPTRAAPSSRPSASTAARARRRLDDRARASPAASTSTCARSSASRSSRGDGDDRAAHGCSRRGRRLRGLRRRARAPSTCRRVGAQHHQHGRGRRSSRCSGRTSCSDPRTPTPTPSPSGHAGDAR